MALHQNWRCAEIVPRQPTPSPLSPPALLPVQDRHNQQCSRIRLVARDSLGGVSGGTIETALTLAFSSTAKSLPGVRAAAAKGKYALDPEGGTGGPDTADGAAGVYEYDAVAGTWVAPFIMAGVNAPVVRKTNALLAYAYGPLMSYSEVLPAPSRALSPRCPPSPCCPLSRHRSPLSHWSAPSPSPPAPSPSLLVAVHVQEVWTTFCPNLAPKAPETFCSIRWGVNGSSYRVTCPWHARRCACEASRP